MLSHSAQQHGFAFALTAVHGVVWLPLLVLLGVPLCELVVLVLPFVLSFVLPLVLSYGPFGAVAGVSVADEGVASSYSLRNLQVVGDTFTNETCVGALEIDRPCNAILIRSPSPIIRILLYAKQ
jgi:hypothetical protein